jgi:type III secretion protein Q
LTQRLPLKTMGKEEVLLLNTIFSRNGQVRFHLGGEEYRLCFLPLEKTYTSAVGLLVGADDMAIWVGLEKALFMSLLDGLLEGGQITDLPDEMRSAALEVVLEELLDQFDAWSGAKSAIREITFDSRKEDFGSNLFFSLTHAADNQSVFGHLSFDRATLEWLAGLLERAPQASKTNMGFLPIPVTFEIGKTRLTLEDFKGVAKGDIILLDACSFWDDRTVFVRLSPNLLLKGKLDETTVTIGAMMEEIMPDEDVQQEEAQETQEQKIDVSNIDELLIDLVFELGEKRVPLKDLMALQPGHTFDLEKSLEKPVSIRANGKIVGFGELVQVDDHIGVRVLDLFGRADV